MSTLDQDYEAILRRCLHAEAESVEPGGDGLQRIRARLKKPQPFLVAWLLADSDVARPVFNGLEAAGDWCLQALRSVTDRFRPAVTVYGRGLGWLRPAAAMTTAIFVVAAGVFAAMELPQAISQTGSLQLPFLQGSRPGGGSGRPHENGHGTLMPGAVAPGGGPGGGSRPAGSSPSCSPSGTGKHGQPPAPSSSPSSTPSSTPSSSPSPSSTPTPTSTPTPSPTPTPSDSATPSVSSATGAADASDASYANPAVTLLSVELAPPSPAASASPSPCSSSSPAVKDRADT